jgi:hypothetical protein
MATRSTIAFKDPLTENVYSVYCHWDGYLSNNGKILHEHYNDLEKVRSLVSLGSISSLGESIECLPGHSWDTPVPGHTVFYARDRGEPLDVCCDISEHSIPTNEYNYYFVNGEWLYRREGNKNWHRLADAFTEE